MKQMDMGVIGNCAVASLIDSQARHVWFCFPRLDGDPVFNALVNGTEPERGFMDIVLRDQKRTQQSYLRNTAILETVLTCENGSLYSQTFPMAHRTRPCRPTATRPGPISRSPRQPRSGVPSPRSCVRGKSILRCSRHFMTLWRGSFATCLTMGLMLLYDSG